MKTIIKSLSIITVLALVSLNSCSKDNGTSLQPAALTGTAALADTKVTPEALPQVILDYVTTNYANATISKSEVENNGNFEVKLNNGTELIFKADGTFLGIDDDTNGDYGDTEVIPADLPQTIKDYVATNHASLTIISASKENNGHFEVKLSDGTELVFDGNGSYLGIGVDDNEANDQENGNDNDGNVAVAPADLPQAIKDYVAANYSNLTITSASKENNGKYEVKLSNGTELEFDANGVFIRVEGNDNGNDGNVVVAPADLPQAIKDYVAANYTGLTITSASKENNGHFDVKLSNGTELEFDAIGNFVKIENND